MNKPLIFIILLALTLGSAAQETNPRETNPFGMSLNLGGPTILLSGQLDYFITPSWNVEAGAGLIGYFAGTKYYFNGSRNVKLTPYLGATATLVESTVSSEKFGGFYVPLGFQHWGKGSFTYSLEVAYLIFNTQYDNDDLLFGAIRLGWRLN